MKLLTQRQYSAYCGKSQGYISKLIKRGMPTVRVGKKRRIDPIAADEWRLKNINTKDIDQAGETASAEEKVEIIERSGLKIFNNVTDAQALDRSYAAAIKKLEFEERNGQLIPVEEVKRDADFCGRLVKERLSVIPGRISALVAVESDAFQCEQILKKEINQILEEISKEVKL